MTVNRQPTTTESNNVKQDTVHWPAKAHRVTPVDSDGNEKNIATEEKQDAAITQLTTAVTRLTSILSELQTEKVYDSGNSTSTLLGAGEVFTGNWIDTTGYVLAISIVITDQAAATNGLRFETSHNQTTIHPHPYTPLSNTPNGHHYPTTLDAKWFRVKYTNGATPQGTFSIITYLFKDAPEDGHTHAINYIVDDDHPAPVRKTIMAGKRADGFYGNVALTNGNNFKISLEELESSISSNNNTQLNVTLFDAAGNEIGTLAHAGVYSLPVTQRPVENFSVHLDIQALSASTNYILVDLSDAINFPHTKTGHIHIDAIDIDINPDTAYRGDVYIGYLKNVDATDGDFVRVKSWHQDLQATSVHQFEHYFPNSIICLDNYHLGPVTANDISFQTDVNLTSPAGSGPSGNGDLALRVFRTAGSIDIGITIIYHTED